MDALLELDADEGVDLLLYAFEAEEDALLYQRWIAGPQFSMSFDDFKHALCPPPPQPEREIIEDAANILRAFGEVTSHGNI